jgi:hypothetical protein
MSQQTVSPPSPPPPPPPRRGPRVSFLAVLGGTFLWLYLEVAWYLRRTGDLWPATVALLLVLGLVFAAAALMLWQTRHDPRQRGPGRLFLLTLKLAGVASVVLGGLFVLGRLLAGPPEAP